MFPGDLVISKISLSEIGFDETEAFNEMDSGDNGDDKYSINFLKKDERSESIILNLFYIPLNLHFYISYYMSRVNRSVSNQMLFRFQPGCSICNHSVPFRVLCVRFLAFLVLG